MPQILAGLRSEVRPFVEPVIGQIVQAIKEAFALAIAGTFWLGIGAALIAAVLLVFLRSTPAASPPTPAA